MEFELKFLVADLVSFRSLIESRGYKFNSLKHQRDHYVFLDDSAMPFRFLRVREDVISGFVSIDYHITHTSVMTEEIENKTDSASAALEFFQAIGFELRCLVEKRREEFILGDVTICLDSVTDLGNFVELEIISDVDSKDRLFALARDLGLDLNTLASRGYPSLLIRKQ